MRSVALLFIVGLMFLGLFRFTETVNSSLNKPDQPARVFGAKTESLSSPVGENDAERALAKGKGLVDFMRGAEEIDEKSDLQKLLQKRRSESRFLEVETSIEIHNHRR